MWLTDSLPSDIPGVRVLTYGYDSHLHKSNSFQDIEAISSSFRTNLGTVRPQIKVRGAESCWSLLGFAKEPKAYSTKASYFPWTQSRRDCVEKGMFFISI